MRIPITSNKIWGHRAKTKVWCIKTGKHIGDFPYPPHISVLIAWATKNGHIISGTMSLHHVAKQFQDKVKKRGLRFICEDYYAIGRRWIIGGRLFNIRDHSAKIKQWAQETFRKT